MFTVKIDFLFAKLMIHFGSQIIHFMSHLVLNIASGIASWLAPT